MFSNCEGEEWCELLPNVILLFSGETENRDGAIALFSKDLPLYGVLFVEDKNIGPCVE